MHGSYKTVISFDAPTQNTLNSYTIYGLLILDAAITLKAFILWLSTIASQWCNNYSQSTHTVERICILYVNSYIATQ